MGQEQSSGVIVNGQQPQQRSCRPCGDWGNKDYNTVKVNTAALNALDKENAPNGKANAIGKEEEERQRKILEWEAQQEKIRREEEQRREMERRVKEEQERQLAEQRQREAERRRLELEQQARDREAKERHLQEMRRQAELERQRQEQERQEQIRLQEEARQRKIKEMDDAKKVRAYLQSNGFKDQNDLVRKKFSKVTPLHFAVGQNNVEMVKLLLAAGADRKTLNGKKETPFGLAQKLDKNGTHAAIIQELQPVTVG